MEIKELTDFLVESSENFYQSTFIPWWTEDYEKFIYRHHVMDQNVKQDAKACIARCGKEDLLTSAGKLGLTLFHLLVWHNFYDDVKEMLCDGRIADEEADMPDRKGHGLTPFLLACARGNLAMVRLLLEHGVKDSSCDDRNMNAYHFLVYPRFEELSNDRDLLERSVEQRAEIARLLTCDINGKNARGLTPLEQLLSTENCDAYTWPLTEIFLEKGAATDYVDENGSTLLMLAAKNGHDTAALRLMKHCPNLLDVADSKGVTPVMHAAKYLNNAMYLALVDHGASPVPNESIKKLPLSQITCKAFDDVYPDNRDSLSIGLYLAEKLIRQIDPDDEDEMEELKSILQPALRYDEKAQVLDLCAAAGLDFTMPFYYCGDRCCLRDECLWTGVGINALRKLSELDVDMNSAVADGKTPAVILASEEHCDEEDEIFFREAAKLFSRESMEQTDKGGEAAVHLAAENGHALMLQTMIDMGVDINLTEDVPAEAGATPLHLACSKGHADIVKLLMAAGADDTMKTVKGDTPAHLVVTKDIWGRRSLEPEQMTEVLKELKHLDLPREDGKTPLMLLRNLPELLPIFLERGVDVNHTDNDGMTALMHLIDKNAAKELLRAGADINIADHEGNTALHHALMCGDQTTARYLIRKGADYNRSNNYGETPVQLAVEHGCESVLELMTDIKA
ncbi:MAG: hypothetical protein HDR26_04940 [Lachnospiraceae bacterium]|nr:hypothetical protein [Lachnospiraceae bacterium]